MSDAENAAIEADRCARRGEWPEASVHCAHAIARIEQLREREPDVIDHLATLADLRYFQAEILTHTGELAQAAQAAAMSLELYRVLRNLNPIHASDRVRDAKSRWRLIELMLRDDEVPYEDRVPIAQQQVGKEPGLDADHDLARQLARQGLDHVQAGRHDIALPLLREATAVYGRLRPLGEDDLVLFAEAGLRAAETLAERGAFAEASLHAADAAGAYGLLSSRRPERFDKPWYDARELAARAEDAEPTES